MQIFLQGISCTGAVVRRALCVLFVSSGAVLAQDSAAGWQVGGALDAAASSRALALGDREQGLGLGHSDITLRGPLGAALEAQATAAAHTHDGRLELELEEAWAQTRALPGGLQLRVGRFSSQLGYLNEQHPHADDFVQRPLLHRAFLGGHWYDDGLRLNWTAATDLYLRLGLEVFRGRQLVDGAASRRPGALVLSSRIGGDIGRSQSWQAGLSLLHNRREANAHDDDHEGHGHGHGHEVEEEHRHGHGASYSGRRMWLAELAWKWAPQGNNRQEQVRISVEHAQIEQLGRLARRSDRHHATYASAVWRFAPAWEVGARHDLLRVRQPHGDHFHDGRLRETAWMLAYKPTHAQTVRMQFTQQRDRGGFDAANHAVQFQYILNFGAHASHAF